MHETIYLTTADVARLRGVTPAAVRDALRRGLIRPRARTLGGMALYTREDLAEYLARPHEGARLRREEDVR